MVHSRYLWQHLLYTDKAMQHLIQFLHDIHIPTQRWYLCQLCNEEHHGQSDIRIAEQGTVNDLGEELQSEKVGDDRDDDEKEEGEVVTSDEA